MKFYDSVNNFTRYCFITSNTVINGCGVIHYEEDIWATYSSSMHIRKSLLTRSRSLKYGSYTIPFYKLGMEYEGNNTPVISSINTSFANSTDDKKVHLIAQIQLYKLGTQGQKTQVITRTVLIIKSIYQSYLEIDEDLMGKLTKWCASQTDETILMNIDYAHEYGYPESTVDDRKWYYEISNFVLVPYKFGLETIITPQTTPYIMGNFFIDPNNALPFIDLTRVSILNDFLAGSIIDISTFSITNDFRNIGIGTYSNIYEITNNGSNIEGKIMFACDDYNFNLFISLQNTIYNITQNYVIEIPISVQSADVTQQQKTARQLEIMNSVLGIGGGVLNVGLGINNIATGSARAALGASTGQAGMIQTGYGEVQNGIPQTYRGITQIAKGIADLVVLNKPLYRTNKGTFSKSIGFVNAVHGLFVFSIDEDNETEVQANIDNAGYVVNEVVGDLLHNMAVANDKPTYNVMSFSFVNNYGYFPEEVRQQLVDILMNGFKIWYDVAGYIAS